MALLCRGLVRQAAHRPRVKARLLASFHQTPGREQFVPAFSEIHGGEWTTRWIGHHGSADLFSINEANSLFVVAADRASLDEGAEVDVVLLTEW